MILDILIFFLHSRATKLIVLIKNHLLTRKVANKIICNVAHLYVLESTKSLPLNIVIQTEKYSRTFP